MDGATGKKRRWGRWLLITLLALLAIGYSILWFVTKPMIEEFADNWVESQRSAGFDIQYSERRVEGFPLNFKLVFDDPVVEARGAAAKWQGEEIRLQSRPWNFYPMLANWWGNVEGYAPGQSTLQDPNGETHQLNLNSASRLLVAWNSEGLTKANLKLDELTGIISGETFETEAFALTASPSSTLAGAFDLNLSWDRIDVPQQWLDGARQQLSDAPPAANAIASGILKGLESGEPFDIPMPNALSLGDQTMLFGLPLN